LLERELGSIGKRKKLPSKLLLAKFQAKNKPGSGGLVIAVGELESSQQFYSPTINR
jgi:hypothetical protein